LANQTYALDE
jgi:hypothetical protein